MTRGAPTRHARRLRPPAVDAGRRRALQRLGGLGLAGLAAAHGRGARAAVSATPPRLALLVGNDRYPEPFDLPPIPKNLRDLGAALERRGFDVSQALDLELGAARAAVEAFARKAMAAPADATLFFYFSGHGVQVDAANLLLPADLNPSAQAEQLRKGSLQLLADVVSRLPERKDGMVIAVVDACRTSLKPGDEGGLNQVEAPQGCLIAFSTGAGKPAIAPSSPDRNTFYTASLVRLLDSVSEETTFPELFRLVRSDVRKTMLAHPIAAIRKLAQDPFIADHSFGSPRVALLTEARPPQAATPAPATPEASPATPVASEEDDWAKVKAAIWPAEVQQRAQAFLRDHPGSRFDGSAQAALEGAQEAARILQRPDVRLFRSAFQLPEGMPEDQRHDIVRAARGDKDAAARLGRNYFKDAGNGPYATRYEGWMQYAAALGNGIASYELSGFYRAADQPQLASRFESRSRELGYTPPPSLDNVRK